MRYSQWKLDAGEFPNPDLAAFAERELESVREEVLQKKLPPLSGRELIPQNMELESWKERYVHQMYELLGTAEFAGDATEDFPLVDVSLSEETFNIRKIGCAYKHTVDEMEKSQALGRGLDAQRASAARRATNEKLNEIMWYGDEREQLFGLVNYPDSPHVVLANPIDDTTAADVIKNMLTDLLVSIFSSTRQSAKPDQIWMATDPYMHIVDRKVHPQGGGDATILEWIVNKHPFIDSEEDVEPVQELDGAGPNGEDLLVVGRFGQNNDNEDVASHGMARTFTQRAPQQRNEAVVTNCVAKSGGVASDYPQEFLVAEVPSS